MTNIIKIQYIYFKFYKQYRFYVVDKVIDPFNEEI